MVVAIDERALEEKVCIVHPLASDGGGRGARRVRSGAAEMEEAVGLAEALGLRVSARALIPVRQKRAGHFFGKGQAEKIGDMARASGSGLVVVNGSLSPVQQRNLEKLWQSKVLDRTALILEIFGARARTQEARLQTELAHLAYQRSRLVRSWTHLERQRGGAGFLGGPGETQGEADRRQISSRMVVLRRRLESVRRRRALHRAARAKRAYPTVALVGYTNAGKSTLFNRLTGAGLPALGRLFDTLDPTTRALSLSDGRVVLLSDTVGFISDLPMNLITAFRATLEEVREASLVVHVRDISHADREAQKRDVEEILCSLGVIGGGAGLPCPRIVEFLNKTDILPSRERRVLGSRERCGGVPSAAVSARTGLGISDALGLISRSLSDCG